LRRAPAVTGGDGAGEEGFGDRTPTAQRLLSARDPPAAPRQRLRVRHAEGDRVSSVAEIASKEIHDPNVRRRLERAVIRLIDG